MARNRQRNRTSRRPLGGRPDQPSSGGGAPPPIEEGLPAVFEDDDDDGRGMMPAVALGGVGGGGGGGVVSTAEAAFGRGGEVPPEALERRPTGSLLARSLGFLRNCWAELQRVQWPDRQQVFQATGVVLGFVVLTGVFLGVCDYVAGKVINWIV
jgi:preprotein translocase subunit SecE